MMGLDSPTVSVRPLRMSNIVASALHSLRHWKQRLLEWEWTDPHCLLEKSTTSSGNTYQGLLIKDRRQSVGCCHCREWRWVCSLRKHWSYIYTVGWILVDIPFSANFIWPWIVLLTKHYDDITMDWSTGEGHRATPKPKSPTLCSLISHHNEKPVSYRIRISECRLFFPFNYFDNIHQSTSNGQFRIEWGWSTKWPPSQLIPVCASGSPYNVYTIAHTYTRAVCRRRLHQMHWMRDTLHLSRSVNERMKCIKYLCTDNPFTDWRQRHWWRRRRWW